MQRMSKNTAMQRIQEMLNRIGSIIGFFLNGHAIVALVQWMVRVAGRVAESALLLATLWVTMNNVAHVLMTWIIPTKTIDLLNYLSLVAFSLLPELIVAAAIKITIEHWQMFSRHPDWRNPAWIWATLYTIPTATFLFMTVTTLSSFVQIEASTGSTAQATGAALTARFLAGWGYSLIEILWASIGEKGYVAILDKLRATVASQEKELRVFKQIEQELRATIQHVTSERESYEKELREKQERLATVARDLQTAISQIATLQQEKATIETERDTERATAMTTEEELREHIEALQEELRIAKARATRREMSRAIALATPQTMATQNAHRSPESQEERATNSYESQEETGYVARDDGATMAIANGSGATIIATGSHRDRIKEAMLRAMASGEQLTYGAIATAAGAGYSTVKKYMPEIRQEIAREMSSQRVVVSQES